MTARQAELLATTRERTRCARVVERVRVQLSRRPPGTGKVDHWVWIVLGDALDRIRRPWAVREAERQAAMPGRHRKSCGLCGDDDHRAPKCHRRAELEDLLT